MQLLFYMFVFMRNLVFIFLFYAIHLASQNSITRNYNTANGLQSNNIRSITQDAIGYLWLATSENGLIRFDGQEFESFTKNNELPSTRINHILYDNDSLYVATAKGLSIKVQQKVISTGSQEIIRVKKVNNLTLLATTQGVYQYIHGKIVPLKLHYQIDLSPILDIAYYNNGYYIATSKALWFVNSMHAPTRSVHINDGQYTSLTLLNNFMFATTKSKGVQVFEPDRNHFQCKTVKRITSVSYANGQYWVATDNNGVYIFNREYEFEKRISKYNGLKVNHISYVFTDRSQNSWLATIGNGIYAFAYPKPINEPTDLAVYFENIKVDAQTVDSIAINKYQRTLYLRPYQNNISFQYKSVDLLASSKLEYSWKLNEKVSPWATENSIDFASLSPGAYMFEVRSKNENALVSKPIKFAFFIDTPIYKKGWFIYSIIGLSVLIVVIIIVLIFNSIRKRNAKKVKALELENHLLSLEQKAMQLQMNPHFIFNVLHGIKALGSQDKTEEMNNTINHFAGLLRGVLQNSREEEITLEREIAVLQKYVYLEQQMSGKSFEFVIDIEKVNIAPEEILIPPMLIQPFIENAIKHGIQNNTTKGLITLAFEIKQAFLMCTITDNGIGYLQNKRETNDTNHRSVALKVTKERIESISGKQSFYISEIVERDQIKGTKVWFRIPLKTEF